MKSIKGTETEKNLLKSFAGESQARSRYKFFASKARKEGYEQIAAMRSTEFEASNSSKVWRAYIAPLAPVMATIIFIVKALISYRLAPFRGLCAEWLAGHSSYCGTTWHCRATTRCRHHADRG